MEWNSYIKREGAQGRFRNDGEQMTPKPSVRGELYMGFTTQCLHVNVML